MALTVYTAGEVLTALSLNDNFTVAAGAGGLTFVTSGTFTTSALVNIDGCFTSTYRNYRVIVDITATTGAGGQVIATQLRASGTAASGANYNYARSGYSYAGAVQADVGTGGTYFFINRSNGSGSAGGASSTSVDYNAPQLAQPTWITGTQADGLYQGTVGGYHDLSSAYDGFNIQTTTGATTITGIYRVYGYKD
tara:strand:- start:107 stop:691 length:585 start_codon:yes stop_codon:yes gene_type:complete